MQELIHISIYNAQDLNRSYCSLELTRLPACLLDECCELPNCATVLLIGVCEGIKMRECDGGTAWDTVESESCPLTPPNQNIQVS